MTPPHISYSPELAEREREEDSGHVVVVVAVVASIQTWLMADLKPAGPFSPFWLAVISTLTLSDMAVIVAIRKSSPVEYDVISVGSKQIFQLIFSARWRFMKTNGRVDV